MEFFSQQYSDEQIKRGRRSLILTSFIFMGGIAYLATSGLVGEIPAQLGVLLGVSVLMHGVGNYKLFVVEKVQK